MQGSSSSDLTVTSIRSDAILELGKKIVDELELDQSVDTLGRWMAHSIAELMLAAEASSAKDRPAKLEMCSDAILALWKHRHELPSGKRPFENLEPIMRTLESLDPDDTTPRYFRVQRTAAGEERDGETANWLKLADNLDYSARLLIGYCLARAAGAAVDKSKEWVALAEKADADVGLERIAVRFISNEKDLSDSTELKDIARKRIEDRLKTLAEFNKMAAALASHLRKQLMESNR